MATDSRGHAPGTILQTDIPSGRLIIDRVDDPLEFRGATPEISVDRGFKSLRPHSVLKTLLTLRLVLIDSTVLTLSEVDGPTP